MAGSNPEAEINDKKTRLDVWLWAARIYKTRSLAKQAIEGGRVHLDGERVKPSRQVRPGNTITVSRPLYRQEIIVDGLAERRGSATVAATLYHESDASITARQAAVAERRLQNAGLKVPARKPDKHDRKALRRLREMGSEPTD